MATDVEAGLARAAKVTVFQTDRERELDDRLTAADAADFLGVPREAVEALLLHGDLPGGSDGLAYHDVAALGLNSGLRTSAAEHGLAMMMRFARQPVAGLLAPLRWSFQIRAADRDPAAGPLTLRAPHAGAQFEGVEAAADGRSLNGVLRTAGSDPGPYVSHAAAQLYHEWVDLLDRQAVRFQWISDEGRRHPLLRAEEGRIDCVCLAAVAGAELQRAGLATRLDSGRVLGLLDARHVWTTILDEDGVWKRFDPLLEAHCRRLWGPDTPYGTIFRGATTNALPGWPGTGSPVTSGGLDVAHTFTAQREQR